MIQLENLKLLMIVQEITSTKLAEMTGKTRQTIVNYLKGTSSPDAEWICLVADYFGVSVDCILDRTKLVLTEMPKAGDAE